MELLSSQAQQSLFESLVALSCQAHQREQTDAGYYALSAAYHAAYHPDQVERIMHEARNRAAEWDGILDECGEVRADDYRRLAEEAQELWNDIVVMIRKEGQE
ncbi:MAG: hypothetical protein HC884_06180 [Chloroflexaceae bacterium]|nr:hypothetical protein [Chloroflexaceae bacterium]